MQFKRRKQSSFELSRIASKDTETIEKQLQNYQQCHCARVTLFSELVFPNVVKCFNTSEYNLTNFHMNSSVIRLFDFSEFLPNYLAIGLPARAFYRRV